MPQKNDFHKIKVTTSFGDAEQLGPGASAASYASAAKPRTSSYSWWFQRDVATVELRYRHVEILKCRGIVPLGYGGGAGGSGGGSGGGASGGGGRKREEDGGAGGGAGSEEAKRRRREKKEKARLEKEEEEKGGCIDLC